jgi:imidazolonepropionase-like amidohydrolase
MTGGHFRPVSVEADGADAVKRAARLQLKNGADVVKVMATGGVMSPGSSITSPQLTVDEMKAAAEEAYKAGKAIAAHAHGAEGIKNATRAGVTTIEHGSFLDEEAAGMMAERGTYLVSTLSTGNRMFGEEGIKAGIPEHIREAARRVAIAGIESFRLAHEKGIRIGLGTDWGMPLNPPGPIVEEVRLLIQAGLSPDEALGAATRVAADILGLGDKIGTIEAGKVADIIAVNGDPIGDCQSLADIAWVMQEGQIVYRKP